MENKYTKETINCAVDSFIAGLYFVLKFKLCSQENNNKHKKYDSPIADKCRKFSQFSKPPMKTLLNKNIRQNSVS